MGNAGRVIYSFGPELTNLERMAKPSGKRGILLSYIYFKRKSIEQDLEVLRKWREYSDPFTLIIDSGIYTLQTKLGLGISATSSVLAELGEEGYKEFRKKNLEKEPEITEYVKNYIDFLAQAVKEDLFTVAIEMDVDNIFGSEYSDKYYEMFLEKIPQHKIMRVWHQSGRDWDGWVEWCHDPEMEWLCIEGGVIQNRNIDFYDRFVTIAIENGKKVHALALTIEQILLQVPLTTTDSSTFVNGGRFGTLKIPGLGHVAFSAKENPRETMFEGSIKMAKNHYSKLSEQELNYCLDWFAKYGYTLEDVLSDKGHYVRSILNLHYYEEYLDLPYQPKPKKVSIL